MKTFDYRSAVHGLEAIVEGGPTQAGYAADFAIHPERTLMPRWYYIESDPLGGPITAGSDQWYLDPEGGEGSPFSIVDGLLRIRMTTADVYGLDGDLINPFDPFNEFDWVSGLLHTKHSFAQQYGVYRWRMKVSKGAQLFPAGWRMPSNGDVRPEWDFEWVGGTQRLRCAALGSSVSISRDIDVGDLDDDEVHDFVLVHRRDTLVAYCDGTPIARFDISYLPEWQAAMYSIVSLGLQSAATESTPTDSSIYVGAMEAWTWIT